MESPADPKNDLIDRADFSSYELRISFENETTHTAVKNGERIYGGKKSKLAEDLSITVTEFLPKGLVMEVPAHTCAEGHRLALTVVVAGLPASGKNPKGTFEFKPTVTVTEIEKVEKGRNRIAIEFIDYDDWSWRELIRIYTERQRQIIEFFEAVKP